MTCKMIIAKPKIIKLPTSFSCDLVKMMGLIQALQNENHIAARCQNPQLEKH